MKSMLKSVLRTAAISVVCYLTIAGGLLLSQWPSGDIQGKSLDFDVLKSDAPTAPPTQSYIASDGEELPYRSYPAEGTDQPLLVIVHGSGWHSESYTELATNISNSGAADIVVPDLRGHGYSPSVRGDVTYIGQLEDDLAELIAHVRKPGQKLYMLGHSSGGGLAIRFAGGEHGDLLEGAIMFAPFLKYNAPTARPNSGGWAQPLTRRIIGLKMLNNVGIKLFNHLTVIEFLFPETVLNGPNGNSATTSYTYALNESFAPRDDYLADVRSLPRYLLVAGKNDEAFHADQYEPTMSSENPNGEFLLLDDVSHLGVVLSLDAQKAVIGFLSDAR